MKSISQRLREGIIDRYECLNTCSGDEIPCISVEEIIGLLVETDCMVPHDYWYVYNMVNYGDPNYGGQLGKEFKNEKAK